MAAHTASNPPWAALPIGSSPPPRPRHRKMHRREGPTSWLWAVPRLPHSPPLHAGSALTCRQPRPPGGRESGNAGRSRRHTDLPTTPRPVPRAGAQPTGAPAAPQPTWRQGGSWKPSEPGGLCAGPSTGPRNPRLPPPPRSGPRRAISKDPFPALLSPFIPALSSSTCLHPLPPTPYPPLAIRLFHIVSAFLGDSP